MLDKFLFTHFYCFFTDVNSHLFFIYFPVGLHVALFWSDIEKK